ncbi:MAG: UbiA family prenyltransferase [Acidobacteria bacterium]|nr:UbiA family prenyltransferase [Acidobacteriota bacterium]
MAREREAGHPVAAVGEARPAGESPLEPPGAAVPPNPLDPRVAVVDLDGTLIQTDLLVEGLTAHLGQNVLRLPAAIALLQRGKAHLKRAMAERHGVQADRLPYNQELIEDLQQRKNRGDFLVLATAADSELAQAVADELGLFDAVVASSDGINRRGARKLEAVRAVIGDQPFLFVGDDKEDRALFDAADAAILVDPPESLRRDLEASGKLRRVIRTGKNSAKSTLKLLRPHQWTKNLLILAPAVAGHKLFDWATLEALLLAIVAFSLAASAVYICNDALDVRADRAHPVKRRRPLASGAVRLPRAAAVAFALALGAVLTAALVGPDFLALLLLYATVSTAYSMWLKSLLVVDLFTLVSLYILRLAAGHLAGHIAYSFWFMMFFFLMLMGLALLKRYSETKMLETRGLTSVEGRAYLAADTPILAAVGASSMMASVVILSLYLQSEAVKDLYSHPLRLAPLAAVVMFVALRLWLLASRSELEKDPILHLASDPYTYVLGAVSFAFVYLAS